MTGDREAKDGRGGRVVQRFWTTREAELRLEEGYLSDPEGPYAEFLGPSEAKRLANYDEVPALVLLGEPGSGKTTALHEEAERLRLRTGSAPGGVEDVVLVVDLRDYEDLADLHNRVFEHAEVARFRAGEHRLVLVFDSLDEALIEMRKLGTRLATELRALPLERLLVRVACRTADWPAVLEHEFAEMWGDEGCRVLEIAPLRRVDVLDIASEWLGKERASTFLDVVANCGAQPFAAKPALLEFLVKSFIRTGSLPTSQAELYAIGCRSLCEETNLSRRAARRARGMSADQRLAIAERVAAAMVFGGRTAVWLGLDRDAPKSDLVRAELLGQEPAPQDSVRVEEDLLHDEVLSTGLFTARGPERLGFAHQTYGEFLAARWTLRRGLTVKQVLSLVTMSDGIGCKLVPQLHETAAWIASLRPDLFAAILDVEPWVLLGSDVARADPQARERLVSALLDAAHRNTLPAPEFGQWLRYRALEHPGIGDQLQTVIADPACPDRVRDLALDIAIACRASQVADVAACLALDVSASIRLRATAARAVGRAGVPAAAERLLPLALESEVGDEDDELKGNALRATWRAIDPATLFGGLTRAKRANFSGAYNAFLGELAESIGDAHVPAGLEWCERLGHGGSPGEQQLQSALILRGFNLLDDPAVQRRLIRRVLRALRRYEPLLPDREERDEVLERLSDSAIRRRVLVALVEAVIAATVTVGKDAPMEPAVVAKGGLDAINLTRFGYLAESDFPFVLERLEQVPEPEAEGIPRLAWGALARDMLDVGCAEQTNAVLERADAPGVRATFRELLGHVQMDGAEAECGRREFRRAERQRRRLKALQARWNRQAEQRVEEVDPLPSSERLTQAVRTADDPAQPGDLPRRRWFLTYFELIRHEKGYAHPGGDSADVRAHVAWQESDASIRAEVLAAAREFIAKADAPVIEIGSNVKFHRYAWGGYVGLRLLHAEAPALLATLPVEGWRRWIPTVAFAEPQSRAPQEREAHLALIRQARAVASEVFDEAIVGAVDAALTTEHWRVPTITVEAFAAETLGTAILHRCVLALDHDIAEERADGRSAKLDLEKEHPADEAAAHERARRADRRACRQATIVELLAALLSGGSNEARTTVEGWLNHPTGLEAFDQSSVDSGRAFAGALALLNGAPDAGWSCLAPIVEEAPDFAKALFLRAAQGRELPVQDFRKRLGERGVAELFVAIVRAFPYETDPWHVGVYSPSARDRVTDWRRALLDALEDWGTEDAITELRRIQSALPQYDWLAYRVARAREGQGRAAWRPVSAEELFRLADDRRSRLVRDGDQLLDLVIESLGRYQRELQGDLPSVVTLWDYSDRARPVPRDEGHFADDIARHFKRDLEGRGIAVGCELVVRRGGKGRAPGLRTDIYVTAAVAKPRGQDLNGGEFATAVIEVKGSWHDEVESAMRTQLVEDYMREHADARHGLFVVGDFTCDAWAETKGKRRSRRLGGREVLARRLEAQAEELSTGGVRIRAVVLDMSMPAT